MARKAQQLTRGTAAVVGIAAIAAHLSGVFLIWQRQPDFLALLLSSRAVLWVPWSAIAIVIALKGVRTAGTSTLALAMTLIALAAGIGVFPALVPSVQERPLLYALLFSASIIVSTAAAGFYLRSSQLFPRALTSADLHHDRAPWSRVPVVRRFLGLFLGRRGAWSLTALWLGCTFVPGLGAAAGLLFIAVGAAYWHVRFAVGGTKDRRRVTWILQTAVAFVLIGVISRIAAQMFASADAGHLEPYVYITANLVSAVACCGSMAMAVFAAGAVSPTLIMRATVVYGGAVAAILFLLNIILDVFIDMAVEALGLSDRLVAALMGGSAGLLAEPLVAWLRKVMTRLKDRRVRGAGTGGDESRAAQVQRTDEAEQSRPC